jgi:predicted deacylase
VLPPEAAMGADETVIYEVKGRDDYVYAPDRGLFEPFHELGAWVEAGTPCGQVIFVDDPLRRPVPCHFRKAGMVMCKRAPGLVERGDCVAHLATPHSG